MAESPAGLDLSGGVRGRDLRQGARRAGHQPAVLRGHRGDRGRAPRHPRDLGRRGWWPRRGREVLVAGAHRGPQPRGRRCVHRGLRRAQRAAGVDHHGVAPSAGAGVCAASDPQHLPLRLPPVLRADGARSAPGLHRPDRAGRRGAVRRVRRALGRAVSGDRRAVAVGVVGVRAVPRLRRGDPAGDLLDQRHRVDQRPLPPRGHRPRALPGGTVPGVPAQHGPGDDEVARRVADTAPAEVDHGTEPALVEQQVPGCDIAVEPQRWPGPTRRTRCLPRTGPR